MNVERQPEDEVARAARKGDVSALFRVFDEHHAALFRFAYRLTGSAADAEDIVQECFLGLIEPGSAFDPARTAVRTYLFGAVRNQALKRLRVREVPREDGVEPVDGRSPEVQIARVELREAVAHAVASLSPSQREVLVLAHYEQLALAEIAELLQIEIGAVKSRLQRARASLKEALADYAPCAGRDGRRLRNER